MGEWKKTIYNRWLPVVFVAAVLLNILLFLGEQKTEHYRLDFSKPVSETVETVTDGRSNDTYIGELSEKEAYRHYLEWLNRYQDMPLQQAQEELTDKKEELTHMSELFRLSEDRESVYGKERWKEYQSRYPKLAQKISSGEANEYQMKLDYVAVNNLLRQLEYLTAYPDYLQSIQENKENMLSFSIFNRDNSFSKRNVCKTADDFSGLASVPLQLGADGAVESFLDFPLTDYFLLLILGVCSLSFLTERKKGLWSLIYALPNGRFRLGLQRLGILFGISCVSVLLLYGSNLLAGFSVYGGIHDLHRSLQSVPMFGNLPKAIGIGTFLLQYFLFRIAAAFLIAVLLWLLFSLISNVKYTLMIGTAFLIFEYGCYCFLPEQSAFNLLKYFNIFTYIGISDLYTHYLNINLFGFPFGIRQISEMAVVPIALLLGVGCLLVQVYKRPAAGKNLLERIAYFLNRFSDLLLKKLHLLGMELYKILFLQKGFVVFLLFLYLACGLSHTVTIRVTSEQEAYEKQFVSELSGEIQADTFTKIEKLQTDLELTIAEYTEATEKYSKGEISFSDYSVLAYEGEKAQIKQEALQKVRERAEYLRELGEQKHFTPYLFDESTFNSVYGEPAKPNQQQSALLAIATIVLLLGGTMAYERQSGITSLLSSTFRGRKKLLWSKVAAAALLTLLVGGIVYGMETYAFYQTCTQDIWKVAVQNLSVLENFPLPCSIQGFLTGLFIFRLFCLFTYGMVVLPLSSLVKRMESAYLLGVAVLVLPSLLYHYFDLNLFQYGAAVLPLEGAALFLPTQGGITVAVMVFMCLLAITLFSFAVLNKRKE